MFSKFTKITMMTLFVFSFMACSHQPRQPATQTADIDFTGQLNQLLAKTQNLERFQMQEVTFSRP